MYFYMLSRVDEKLWKTAWYIYYPLYALSIDRIQYINFGIFELFYCHNKGLYKFIIVMAIIHLKNLNHYDREITQVYFYY